jgi:putative peptidoglycan lipid II flippase
VSARLIEPGSLLADRYLVEDLLAEDGPAHSWRAFDQVLSRSVVLQIVPSSSPYAEHLLDAAKRASHVTDPRILQVLDAVDDGQLTYVVREWVNGQGLEVILAEGPLSARRAAWLIRELSAAIASAHSLGVAHHRLVPDAVVVTKASGVKILGLGTSAALHYDEIDFRDLEYDDTVGLGQLLYACLTARWPGSGSTVLPSAPQVHGQCLRPRQVRAGVPRALDQLCDRILTRPSRYGHSLISAAAIRDELTSILAGDPSSGAAGGLAMPEPVPAAPTFAAPEHPALLRRESSDGPTAPPTGATQAGGGRSSLPKALLWTALAVLVVGALLLGYLVKQQRGQPAAQPKTSPGQTATSQTAPPLHRLAIADAQSFDPYPGSGDENPDLVPLAIDNNPATAWETLSYYNNPAMGGEKDGVGLLLDLGTVQDVRLVKVALQGSGTSLELRAARASTSVAPASSAQEYRLLGTVTDAASSAVFRLKEPFSTRYLLVWLTSLPPDGTGVFRGRVAEVKVFG